MTINGQCFDASAAIQSVTVSGAGVSVINVVVLDDQHVQCTFDIGPLAGQNARDVTVVTGSRHHTLVNGFTVT